MKQSLRISTLALALTLALSACGGSPDAVPAPAPSPAATVEPVDAAYSECLNEWAQGVADLEGGVAADYLDDPDVVAVCEGFQESGEAFDNLPAYTPAPAAEVDPECLRDYAEGVAGPDGMFPGLTVEEIMEDPMARFSCE